MRRRTILGSGAILAVVAMLGLSIAPAADATPGPQNAPEYWFDTWDIPSLWQSGADGHGEVIAEIDTGVNAALPELQGKIESGIDFGSGGNGQIDRQVNDFGHGTAMASIMVGAPGVLGIEGIAPAARVLPIAVPLTGTTDANGDDHLAAAIRYAADHGGKIISMSLGGARYPARDSIPCPTDEQDAIYYALAKGSILLAASGNSGPTTNTVEEPGVCLGVLSVGAVDITGRVADFSARHPYLTLTAPGVNIPSLSRAVGAAYSGDGTSQATAIASAVAALVWSAHPSFTAQQVAAQLIDTTDQHTGTPSPAYGYGIVNALRAVRTVLPASAPNPVYAAANPFLNRFRAFHGSGSGSGTAAPPLPAARATPNLGTYAVGGSPRIFVPGVLHGLYAAGLALLGLILLTLARPVVRRRPPRSMLLSTVPAASVPIDAPRSLVAPPDENGVVWHTILGADEQREQPSDTAPR